MEIDDLKKLIATKLNVDDSGKIRLTLGNVVVDVYQDFTRASVSKSKLTSETTLNVLILMLVIKQKELKNIVFDLFWKFPEDKRDYLDATCLIYDSSGKFVSVIDFGRKSSKNKSVVHSGDADVKEDSRTGHHTIQVNLEEIPKKDHHRLYFVLSSWDSSSMAAFRAPSVRVYEKSAPESELSAFELKESNQSQAVIMCCLIRRKDVWDIVTLGKQSKGNAKTEYSEIKETITQHFDELNIAEDEKSPKSENKLTFSK